MFAGKLTLNYQRTDNHDIRLQNEEIFTLFPSSINGGQPFLCVEYANKAPFKPSSTCTIIGGLEAINCCSIRCADKVKSLSNL